MKFSLKNRPKIPSFYDQRKTPKQIHDEMLHDLTKCFTWFEGFEKEIREKLAKCADQRHTSPNNSAYLLLGMESIIRQILGDELKTEPKP